MRRTVWLGVFGVVVAALWAAAVVAWVDAWPAVAGASQPAPVRYAPPVVIVASNVTGVDQADVAAYVDRATNDPRGWRTDLDQYRVGIVQPGQYGTQRMPGTIGRAYPDNRLAVITSEAWTTLGSRFAEVGGTLDDQRMWVVLHELGHLLGHEHVVCPAPGQPAPLMRPVDYQLDGCAFNVWPNP